MLSVQSSTGGGLRANLFSSHVEPSIEIYKKYLQVCENISVGRKFVAHLNYSQPPIDTPNCTLPPA